MEELTCGKLNVKIFKHSGHTPGMERPLWHITQIIKHDLKQTVNKTSYYKMHFFLYTDSINRLKNNNNPKKQIWQM